MRTSHMQCIFIILLASSTLEYLYYCSMHTTQDPNDPTVVDLTINPGHPLPPSAFQEIVRILESQPPINHNGGPSLGGDEAARDRRRPPNGILDR